MPYETLCQFILTQLIPDCAFYFIAAARFVAAVNPTVPYYPGNAIVSSDPVLVCLIACVAVLIIGHMFSEER